MCVKNDCAPFTRSGIILSGRQPEGGIVLRAAKIKRSLLLAWGLILLVWSCGGRDLGPDTRFSLADLRADFGQLRTLIADHHPKTFSDWRELDSAFDHQRELLTDDLTLLEFLRVIAPAVATVRCGHTRLSFSDSISVALRNTARHLPLDIRVLHDSLFVYEAYGENPVVPPGSAVLSINGKPSAEITGSLKSSLPADGYNETYKVFQINGSFREKYFAFVESPEEFEIVFAHPDSGGADTAVLTPLTPAQITRSLDGEDDQIDPESEAVEWSFDENDRFATLRVWAFDFYDDLDRFTEMIDGFFVEMGERGIKSLILDLRGNDGGDPYSSSYLLTYLIGEPFRYFSTRSAHFFDDLKDIQHPPDEPFDGDLYVLVDGGSYSTTGHFCSLLKYHEVGTFIGVETGGSFACHGGYKEKTLNNSGINLLLPHTTFITDVQGLPKGRGIAPDFEVEPSIFDLLEGRDPVFEKAVSLIESGGDAGTTRQ